MKRFLIMVGMVMLLTVPVSAAPTFHFGSSVSPTGGLNDAWQLVYTASGWQFSFFTDNIVVLSSDPADAVLVGDHVGLPIMTLSGAAPLVPNALTVATLTPDPFQQFRILSDPGNVLVFT